MQVSATASMQKTLSKLPWSKDIGTIPYLPFLQTSTCVMCGSYPVPMDPKRVWPLDFLLEFVDHHCSPTPYIFAIIAAMSNYAKENTEFSSVLICKDCMTWAGGLARLHPNEDNTAMVWSVKDGKKMGRRVMKHIRHHFLPMDALFLFLHAPSEEYQSEYRMLCRLLLLLVEGRSIYHRHSSTVLQSILHKIENDMSILKGVPKYSKYSKYSSCRIVQFPVSREKEEQEGKQEEHEEKQEEQECVEEQEKQGKQQLLRRPLQVGKTIAVRIGTVWYELTGKRLLVRGHPKLGQYIRKILSKT